MTREDDLDAWCEARNPDPFGVGWDDPVYRGSIARFHHCVRVLGCVFWGGLARPRHGWPLVQVLDALYRWLSARRDR